MYIKALFVFAVVFSSGGLFAQNQKKIDSLTTALNIASNEDAVLIYRSLGIVWVDVDNKKSLQYFKKAYHRALNLGDSVQMLKSLRLVGMILRRMERYDSAEAVMVPLISVAKTLKQNEDLLYLYMSLGGLNLYTGHYDRCLRFYNDAFNLPEIEEDQDVKLTVLFNIGFLYYKVHDMDRALEYNFNTLALLRGNPRMSKEIPQLLLNISLCYIFKHDFEKARLYLEQATAECGENCSGFIDMQRLFTYGRLYQEQKILAKAEMSFLKANQMAIAQKDVRFQLDNIELLAEIYTATYRFVEARRLLTRADSILAITRYNSEAERIYWQHILLYRATGDTRRLATYYEKYLQVRDSVFSEKLRVSLTRVEGEYQKRAAAQEIKNREERIELKDSLINSQRVIIALSVVTTSLLAIVLVYSIKRNRARSNTNLLLEEKVKERTADYAASLLQLKLQLKSDHELTNKLLSETNNVMVAVRTLTTMLEQDLENNALYAADIRKLSLKVSETIGQFQRVRSKMNL